MVILVLGILAGVGVARLQDTTADGEQAALQKNVEVIQNQIDLMTARNNGVFPAEVSPSWFQGNRIPHNPYNRWGVPDMQIVAMPGLTEPGVTMIGSGSAGAYWYNSEEGIVRARVSWQGDSEATILLYNAVNNTDYNQAFANLFGGGAATGSTPNGGG